MSPRPLAGRVALVTGANHGIGAATAAALAGLGADVAVTYLRSRATPSAADDPARPAAYAEQRRQGAEATVAAIEAAGVRSLAIEADLADPASPARLFDAAEAALGPVEILVNNASGWRKDTFAPEAGDRFGRGTERVSAATFDAQFHVDARAAALLIAEFAARHRARGAPGAASSASRPAGRRGSPARPPTEPPRRRSTTTRCRRRSSWPATA